MEFDQLNVEQVLLEVDKLPEEQKDFIYGQLLLKKLESRDQLRRWCKFFLNVDLADCVVSRFSTSSPLDMVWDIYNYCMTNDEAPITTYYIAGRASQKTLSAAVLQVLLPIHFKRNVGHFGGTKAQAQRAYSYFQKFAVRPYIRNLLKSDPTQQKTIFVIEGEEVEIEIQSITMTTVQGAHPNILSLDELASMAPDKVKAYEDLEGVPVYTNDGKPWIRFGISSRKGAATVIESAYETRNKTGAIFKFWTVLENTKRCPDEISGTEDFEYYGNALENKTISTEEYGELSEVDQSKFEHIKAKTGCFTCPMSSVCGGDLKKQTSTCRTLRPAKALIQEFKNAELQWFLSQKMAMTPSLDGIIFNKFKREVFEKTPSELWEIYTGEKPSRIIVEEELFQLMMSKDLRCVAGLDHGFTHPSTLIIAVEDKNDRIYIFKAQAQSGLDPEQRCLWVQRAHEKYQFTSLYPDTADPSINAMFKKLKLFAVHDEFDKKGGIQDGITLIRKKIAPTIGGTKFYGVKGNCEPLIVEMEKYHYLEDTGGKLTDNPVDDFNHCFTEGHEILTENGWKNFRDLTSTDKVAAVTEDKKILFEIPKDIIANEYSGEVMRFKNDSIEFCVTPNHRVAHIPRHDFEHGKTFDIKLTQAKDLTLSELFIPASATAIFTDEKYAQPFARGLDRHECGFLLGTFISEGRTHAHETTYQHKISKTSNKCIPRDVLRSKDQALLTGLFQGLTDGSAMDSSDDYTTTSPQLAEDFVELCVLLGKAAKLTGPFVRNGENDQYYKVIVKKGKDYPALHVKIADALTTEAYSGKVYCVSVSTGMIMCRYKGTNFISGNSIDALRYVAINRWKGKNELYLTPDKAKVLTDEEINRKYKADVQKRQDNWLADEIKQITNAAGTVSAPSQSKNKSLIWSID